VDFDVACTIFMNEEHTTYDSGNFFVAITIIFHMELIQLCQN